MALPEKWMRVRAAAMNEADFELTMTLVRFLAGIGAAAGVLASVNRSRDFWGEKPARTLEQALREHIERQSRTRPHAATDAPRWSGAEWLAFQVRAWLDDKQHCAARSDVREALAGFLPGFARRAKKALKYKNFF